MSDPLTEVPGAADRETKKLADFIMTHVPGEPSRSESAVDCAIRIMRDLGAHLCKRCGQEHCVCLT